MSFDEGIRPFDESHADDGPETCQLDGRTMRRESAQMRATSSPGAGGTHAARRADLFDTPLNPISATGLTLLRPIGRKDNVREMPRAKRPGLY
jgi:hypothetical protein